MLSFIDLICASLMVRKVPQVSFCLPCPYLSLGFCLRYWLIKPPAGGRLHVAWAKGSLQEAEVAEGVSDLALTTPAGIPEHGGGAW